jgi:hypothetical protein
MTRLLLGVPTRNESATIRQVTRDLDLGALALGDNSSTLCLADGGSTDDTAARFLETQTSNEKVVLNVDGIGKGRNVRALFEFCIGSDFDGLICVDGDLLAVPPQWVRSFTDRLRNGAGLVVANYPRPWNDANMTNQIAVPVVLASTGVPIREPIGGDFACSRQFMERALSEPWGDLALNFGVDLFLLGIGLDAGDVQETRLEAGKHQGWRAKGTAAIRVDMTRKIEDVRAASAAFARTRSWPSERKWGTFTKPAPLNKRIARRADPQVIQNLAASALADVQRRGTTLDIAIPNSVEDFATSSWAELLSQSLVDQWDEAKQIDFQHFFFIRMAETYKRLGATSAEAYKQESRSLAAALAYARGEPLL